MQKTNSAASAQEPEETIVRLSWLLIHERKVLFVRSPKGQVFFDPGGRRKEGANDLQVLSSKIRHDLGVELDLDSVVETTSFKFVASDEEKQEPSFVVKAPAFGKPEDVMVEMHCYMSDYIGTLNPAPAFIAEMDWFTSSDMRKTSDAGKAILQHLEKEGLID